MFCSVPDPNPNLPIVLLVPLMPPVQGPGLFLPPLQSCAIIIEVCALTTGSSVVTWAREGSQPDVLKVSSQGCRCGPNRLWRGGEALIGFRRRPRVRRAFQ